MTTNLDRASVVSRDVTIEAVNLSRAEMRTNLDPLDPPEITRLAQRFRCRFELPSTRPNHVVVHVNLVLDGTDIEATEEDQPLVSINATFTAVYELEDARTYPRDALQHFAELNGTYNVWPYWRELVQTFAARAGMGGLVVPVFRPRPRRVPEPDETAALGDPAQKNSNTLYAEFYRPVVARLRPRGLSPGAWRGRWRSFKTGHADAYYGAGLDDGKVKVFLYLEGPNRTQRYNDLVERREEIDKALGGNVSWKEESDGSSLMLERGEDVSPMAPEEELEFARQWMVDKLLELRNALQRHLDRCCQPTPAPDEVKGAD